MTYDACIYQFKLPTFVLDIDETFTDVKFTDYLEVYMASFDEYISKHPTGDLFPFRRDVVIKNMAGVQKMCELLLRSTKKNPYEQYGHLGTPERGYVYNVVINMV